jgi:hypothetical protein
VASSSDLKDMCQRKAPLIGCRIWHRKERDLQDLEGVFLAKCHMMASNLREEIMENILRDDDVNLTIIYCPRNISAVMIIWKWPLVHTTMEGFSLKEFLLLYDESYVLEVDAEGMIGVKKNIYSFSKKK